MELPLPWQGCLRLLVPLALGVLCLRLGSRSSLQTARLRHGTAGAAVAVAVTAAAAHYPPLRDLAGPWVSLMGGEGVLACLGALVLLGQVWTTRERSTHPLLLTAATGLVFLLLVGLVSGALGWRLFGRPARANYPDARGALQQSTGISCGPAAAAMLLHRHGIRISEGELAERANTTPILGTDPYALARAIDAAGRRHGFRGRARRVDYEAAQRLHSPFVALVRRPGVGGHAVCVVAVSPSTVSTIDPLSGTAEELSRQQFLAEWDPIVVWAEPARREGMRRRKVSRYEK